MLKVNDIPNIEHCIIENFGNPTSAYRITANDGWRIFTNEEPATSIIIPINYDMTKIVITEIA
ncbi:MAG: hypothetical protein IJZ16_09245 [Clostridia bacterium]|nr:hypothetical protein [Clostridia bacterium]